jgi:hypothetical protein
MTCQSHRKSGVITVCSFPRYLWRGVVCMPASRGPVSHFCADMSTGVHQLAGVSHELARLACRHRPTGGFKARACGVGLAALVMCLYWWLGVLCCQVPGQGNLS